MTQQLRALTALLEDSGSVLFPAHTCQLTTIHNSSSRCLTPASLLWYFLACKWYSNMHAGEISMCIK